MWFKAFSRNAGQALGAAAGLVLMMAAMPALAAPVALTSLLGSPAEGTWQVPSNGAEVNITPCGDKFCGTLNFVHIPAKEADQCRTTDKQSFAQLMLDYNNPDPAQKTRPILGLHMLTLTPTSDPNTFTGRAYNAEDGSTNDVSVWIINGNSTLRLGGGCVASICVVTQDWPRVPDRPGPDFSCEGGN